MIIHVNGVERDANENEIAEIKQTQSQAKLEAKIRQAEAQAQEAARASALAKLAELGLTAEEIAAL